MSGDNQGSLASISHAKYWLMGRGRRPLFETPEKLIEAAIKYFQWLEENPLHEAKVVSYQGNTSIEDVPKMRAATLTAMCLHMGTSPRTWLMWKSDRPDLKEAMDWCEDLIRDQKYVGGAAGLLNPNIIMRDLGLAERNELSGPNGQPLQSVVQYQLPSNGREDLPVEEDDDAAS